MTHDKQLCFALKAVDLIWSVSLVSVLSVSMNGQQISGEELSSGTAMMIRRGFVRV